MNTKLLRQNILTLAISGRLVPQDAAEGNADDLIKLIAAERTAKLQAEANRRAEQKAERTGKKVEPEKVEPIVITPLPAKDAPFAIPDSWRWVRLGEIAESNIGLTYKPSDVSVDGVPVYRSNNIKDKLIDKSEIVRVQCKILDKQYLHEGDLLICARNGSRHLVGKCALVKELSEPTSFGAFMAVCRSRFNAWIFHLLNTDYFNEYLDGSNSAMINQVTQSMLLSFPIPLPPLSEQERIVSAIERWFAQADAVEQSGAELKKLSALAMRRVLSLAISGKLVPQDAAEGTAADLLTLIAAARTNKLQAEANRRAEQKAERTGKKVEPEKVQPVVITPLPAEDAPFAVPDSWRWVKVEDVFEVNPKNDIDDELTVGFVPMECVSAGYSGSHTFVEKKWDEIKKGYTHFKDGDYAVAKISPCFENLKSVILKDLPNGYGAGTTELVVLRPYMELTNYFLWLFKSKWYIDQGCVYFKGNVGQQRVGKSIFTTLYIPLPPLSEQYRIVEKIEAAERFLRQVAEGV